MVLAAHRGGGGAELAGVVEEAIVVVAGERVGNLHLGLRVRRRGQGREDARGRDVGGGERGWWGRREGSARGVGHNVSDQRHRDEPVGSTCFSRAYTTAAARWLSPACA